jgi:dolichol-phosphate mannosyltransferase
VAAFAALAPGRNNKGVCRNAKPSVYLVICRVQQYYVVLSILIRCAFTGLTLWLALPTMAWMMGEGRYTGAIGRWLASLKPTIAICLFLCGFAMHFLVLGIPGLPTKPLARVS